MVTKEHAIFQAQNLYLIYTKSRILYEIIHDTPRLNHDPNFKPKIHSDGIVFFTSAKDVDSVTHQMQKNLIN